ncbi:MAG: GTP-binding protein [Clostridiales bacterium]|nr:GTP-binding protein [Clostridiales bacterium]
MIKIDLITGFLGSGKTTFIKKYARFLMNHGDKIGILENDYGAVNVDMMLLQDLTGEQCDLEMISGGCDKDCHKRRFRTKLIAMGMLGYDRVLLEPSGIYDVDEFFDTLYESPLDRWYEPGNVIAIVDARLERDLSEEAQFILASEVANAGCVLFSKCQEASLEEIRDTIEQLNRALERCRCARRFSEDMLITKDWEQLTEDDFEKVLSCGYVMEDYRKDVFEEDGFTSVYFMNMRMSEDALRKAAEEILRDSACGRIFRMKGFIQTGENQWLELNATRDEVTIRPIEKGQEILIVIGEHPVRDAIEAHLASVNYQS